MFTRIAQVRLWENIAPDPWRIWKLTPVRVDGNSAVWGEKKHDPPPKYSENKQW